MNKRGWPKVWLVFIVVMAAIGRLPTHVAAQPVVHIGMVVDGPWETNQNVAASFQQEILALTEGEFDVRFPPDKLIMADWTLVRVQAALDQLLADPEVDLVIASGILASAAVSQRGPLPKPVIAPFILDRELQNAPYSNGVSGVVNLSYLTFPTKLKAELKLFLDIVPMKRVAVLQSWVMPSALPNFVQYAGIELLGIENLQIEFITIEGSGMVEAALNKMSKEVEGVFVTPLLGTSADDFKQLVLGLNKRKLAAYSVVGTSEVAGGLLMGSTPDFNLPRLARRVGLNVQQALLDKEPGTFKVTFPGEERLTINMATARAIGVYPRFEVLTEAVLLNEERRDIARKISLYDAVREAVDVNLDIEAQKRAVASGYEEMKKARALLLPQVDIKAQGVMIDKDLALPQLGQVERSLSGVLSVKQLIFSDGANGNIDIQKHIQQSREFKQNEIRLDIMRETAVTYLNLLRIHTFERIQKENLKLSRSNLDLAQVRQGVGFSGLSEVYRWESQIARDRIAVIQSSAQRNLVEMALNRLLHRPLEEPFETVDVGLNDPYLISSHQRIFDYISNPWLFDIFRSYRVQDGLAASVELKQLDAVIAAQTRAMKIAQRKFWAPTVAAQGEWSNALSRSGAGSQAPAPGGDTNWKIGLEASLPLFSGGERFAKVRQARQILEELQLERSAVAERIEQHVRSTLHWVGASRAAIRLSRDAAEAAGHNLELTTDAYSRGAVSILELLDAQNAALRSQQGAASAVYDFLIDVMEAERAVGGFNFFRDPVEVKAYFDRLDAHYKELGAEVRH